MNKKIMLQSSLTLTLFFLINWGVWEGLVILGMEEPWASFTVYAVLIVIVISIWHKPLFKEWIRFKDETKNLKKFFSELLVWLVIAIVLAYGFQYLVNGVSKTDNTDTVGNMVDSIPPILSCLMMSVFTPFIEEITFRKSLIGWIDEKNKTGIIIMMIISIILFDCIHLFRWQEFFYYLPLSIALTLFYVKHNRNIYSSIIMHAMMNLPGAILMIIGII